MEAMVRRTVWIRIAGAVLLLGWVLMPGGFAFAQPPASAPDLAQLIAKLQAQIAALEAQVALLKSELVETQAELKFTRGLQRGASGEEVRELQAFLKRFPDIYPEGLVTGYFGSLTETALKRWQERQGLEAAGVVGPKTRAKLNELVTEGAGESGLIPPGLLRAPGLERLGVTTTPPAPPPAPAPPPPPGATTTPPAPTPPPPPSATTTPPAPVPAPPPPAATTTPPVPVPPPPPASGTPDIRTGTGSVASGGAFSFPTGTMNYSLGDYGTNVSNGNGYLLTSLTNPAVSFASVIPLNQYTADYQGISNICQFTSAASYTFSQPAGVRLYEKASSYYHGILLFKQGSYYGAIDPEDITASGALNYRYWYDASGGSNFSGP